MPTIERGEYLVSYLWDIGPTSDSSPLTFSELRAWQDTMGIELKPWEAQIIRRLSCDYLSESHKATKRNSPAPAPEFAPNINTKTVQQSLRALTQL
jgi:hypothetical protein